MMKNNKEYSLVAVYVLAIAGIVLTGFIEASSYWPYLKEICGVGGGGCSEITATKFAKIFNLSVAWWGMLAYVLVILSLSLHRILLPIVTSVMMGAELYFLWVMADVVNIWCTVCLVQFGLTTVLFFVSLKYSLDNKLFLLPGKIFALLAIVLVTALSFSLPVKLEMHSGSEMKTDEFVSYFGDLNSEYMVEIFSDFGCSHCKYHEPEIVKLINNRKDILILFRDRVLMPESVAAVAASYANGILLTQGKDEYLKARTALFDHQHDQHNYLKDKLATFEFTSDLKKEIEEKMSGDLKRARSLKIYSTPVTFITKNGVTIKRLEGSGDFEQINALLK
ncbi:MAG: vitamin K epoxide reductase family protein [Nitrospinota bacterium]